MAQPDPSASRRAQLERLVYGAGASEEERAAAEHELTALRRRDAGADAPAGSDAPRDADAPAGSDAAPAPGAASDTVPAPSPDPAPRAWYRSRALLVAASAAVFGLLLGGLVGWQLSRTAIVESGLGTPIAGSGAEALLLRSADFDDRPSVFDAESGIDRDSLRRIATSDGGGERADRGVAAYGARSTDGRELCLAVVWERMGGGGAACTSGGRIPPNGLTMEMGTSDPTAPNGILALRATWFADGTVQLGIPLL
ncbi:hypothetical protein [Agromyces mediolanus]|uniref:hypothetical protein n=1 Tax=Agromyces mediolanus TaxID=41986 RepID=UPI001E5266A0|nr:hypothetical protein [Agromyces mediolanus]MCD1571475.1 hypothetical protein [Agromyces mediolanus]